MTTDSTPISWRCPQCGYPDGWGVAPARRRVWVEASCPSCDCDYRVLVTQTAPGVITCLIEVPARIEKQA